MRTGPNRVALAPKEAAALIGSIVPFFVSFLDAELDTQLKEHLEEDVWQELLAIEQVYLRAKQKADECIAELRWAERNGAYHPVWSCAACDNEYMVEFEEADEHGPPQAKCLLCNHVSELKECWKCGELFPEDDWEAEGGLCARCTDYLKQPYT